MRYGRIGPSAALLLHRDAKRSKSCWRLSHRMRVRASRLPADAYASLPVLAARDHVLFILWVATAAWAGFCFRPRVREMPTSTRTSSPKFMTPSPTLASHILQ